MIGSRKVAEHAGNRRNQEEPDHDHPVQGECTVVAIGGQKIALRRDQFDANQARCQTSDKEKEGHGDHVQHRNTLVVTGQKPRQQTLFVQIAGRTH
jgi:hypothetical protein